MTRWELASPDIVQGHDLMHIVDAEWRGATLCHAGRAFRVSGAEVTSPMEGVTGTLVWLGHMPRRPWGGPWELGTVYLFRIV